MSTTSAATRSLPDDPEPGAGSVVGDGSHVVGFLDLPGATVDGVAGAVCGAFATLAPGAVLTVYSDRLSPAQAAGLCRRCGIELLGSIPHPGRGTTFTFRSAPPPVR